MARGRGKVEFEDLVPGKGEVATRECEARITVVMRLHGQDLVDEVKDLWVDLKRRYCIAGLRYGIEGMRVGGHRRVIVPPHLAYGAEGLPGYVPANAILICEVELHELRPTHPITPKLLRAQKRKEQGRTGQFGQGEEDR